MFATTLANYEQQLVRGDTPGAHAPAALGVALLPLSKPDTEAVLYNEDLVFPAASTIKTFLLHALLASAQAGTLSLHEQYVVKPTDLVGGSGVMKTLSPGQSWTLLDIATLMIIVSDNTATNIIFERVGRHRFHEVAHSYGWTSTFMPRKLMLNNPEPSPEGFPPMSQTTPRNLAEHFAKLWRGELLNSEYTNIAKRIYLQQQYLTLGRLLNYEGSNADHNEFLIGSKTGSIDGVRHDTGIFCLPEPPYEPLYAVAILTKGCDDNRYVPDNRGGLIVSEVSKFLFEWYMQE